ncbi:MAG: hypothetical protein A2Y03_02025 [Omnitrophica WOR_2 bacterium GWF2_38_59]|nr:MAG: hypothetical protein A2Y03_02025 [Omnitrophica WOR_2 bacterium GWF2_38_59]OGX47757.1 MAG: hypothetical protein A2243_00440 [Omnitrophica WOR_2 bacterium RIFOXYA2_FULL_38_17]OGX52625.1 MAG: hypothetical protein A2267_03225 [Omnitrophica WOR_2 bacterium RIFOXYA12_FULL_38_10]OGX56008.1 MAG: hypothetical protein A2306_00095 [Omnitrophica WOR_2 bacterium RIFOXYB2_FULL_38_16]OGX57714.1 MAG: hypothetical protein A2447_06400 [Omnitrophica WOR_2 bacterium RIFOXYC2_FULL_38_12]HBG60361.1 hypothet
MFEDLKRCIEDIARPILGEINADIVELKVYKQNNITVIEIIADKVNGGINSDECAYINREVSRNLEELEIVGSGYAVNVFSPGVDRPLKDKRDFMRVMGRDVRFFLNEKLQGKLEHSGIVSEVFDNEVKIKVKSEELVILYETINKAVQII